MSYPTPLTTLSAALSTVPIAPELMGNEGLPPPRPSSFDASTNPQEMNGNGAGNGGGYTGYANSSLRDGELELGVGAALSGEVSGAGARAGNRNGENEETSDVMLGGPVGDESWGYDQAGEPHLWESTYQNSYTDTTIPLPHDSTNSTNPNISQSNPNPISSLGDPTPQIPGDNNAAQLKRKRSRNPNPNPRPRPKTKDLEDPLENADNVEYEHPSKDFRLGSVFVHPPQGSAQACVRCHRIKRKCEGGKPRCTGCGKADVACVFELNAATSG